MPSPEMIASLERARRAVDGMATKDGTDHAIVDAIAALSADVDRLAATLERVLSTIPSTIRKSITDAEHDPRGR